MIVSYFNPTKPEFRPNNILEFVATSQETCCFSIIKTNWLTQFSEIICIYSENNMKHIKIFCLLNEEFVNVKAGGTYSNRCTF
jgi:hypothetical protein